MNEAPTLSQVVIALTLGGLTTFRLSVMLTKEDGPLFIFRKLRSLPKPKTSLKEGAACQWCASVWFAAPITGYLCWLGWFPLSYSPLFWLSISGLAIAANQTWTRDK